MAVQCNQFRNRSTVCRLIAALFDPLKLIVLAAIYERNLDSYKIDKNNSQLLKVRINCVEEQRRLENQQGENKVDDLSKNAMVRLNTLAHWKTTYQNFL